MTQGADADTPPPSGWYPDPYGEAAQRWWDGAQWTGDTQAEPPAPQPVDHYKLKGGSGIELGVNLGHLTEATEAKLLGRKRDEYVERTVKVVMYREAGSPYRDSVRVELPSGEFVGWVLKDDSDLACHLIDKLSKARKRRVRGRPIVLHVSMRVEGETSTDGGEVVRDVDVATIRVADPVTAEPV